MIAVFTLTRQHKILEKELTDAFHKVIEGYTYILGPNVEAFERAFAKYLGVKYSVGVASGTDALTLALLALGVGPEDEVILPANSYPSAFGVAVTGVTLRLVDIDPTTFTLDPSKLEGAITKKTKAIIPVHMYGQSADMEEIMGIARKHKISVVEDCAQAHGAEVSVARLASSVQKKGALRHLEGGRMDSFQVERSWKKVGTIGELGCFSFYPTKNLGALGDGGMIVTNNKKLYQKVKLLRMYGEKKRYQSVLVGRNSRLDELQAALLLVKLKYLDEWIERRRRIAKQYNEQWTMNNGQLPQEAEHARHVYHLFVIRSKMRDALKAYLEKKGIGTAIHYPIPIHLVPSFAYLGYKKGDFPESEKACLEVLSLPMFPELTDSEIKTVTKAIAQFDAIAQ